MAWRCSQLLLAPVLLLVLASGVWGSTVVSEELHTVVGQDLSVRCQYKPEAGPYVPKSWCRQTSPNKCNRVVTTSEPRRAVKESQHTIWDDPEAGFFSITVTQLTEKDSAFYWCGLFSASQNVIDVLRNISLVVSQALPTLPPPTSIRLQTKMGRFWRRKDGWPGNLGSLRFSGAFPLVLVSVLVTGVTAIFASFLVLTTSPEETTGFFTNGSEHRKHSSPSPPGWVSPRLPVFVQYGLLLFKGLMLSVCCVVLCRRRCQGREDMTETVMMEAKEYPSLPEASESLGTFSRMSECEKNDYSPNPTQWLPDHCIAQPH
ncbi:trem-like transcript 4 protein [Peromyscus californicus insignis]|uniref:trem-like transcript 4 protein n=1 Tax=Peromyscus californicus insignis TaxID=564181 RepID=UPI0022A7F4E6|nr:trem-like transcript 4 protein [Peromyscus californicus insignis]